MAKKLPYFPLYTGDWKKDPCVTRCALATRAVWIELLIAMHEDDRSGEVKGTPAQMAAMCRCTVEEFKLALCELNDTKTARVTIRNGSVTVVNRRMSRDAKVRRQAKLRQRKHRESQECHALSSMSSSISRSTVDRQDDLVRVTVEGEIADVRRRALAVVTRIGRPAETPSDRSLVLKAAVISLRAPFNEHWLYDAAEGVARSKARKVYPYLHKCLENSAEGLNRSFAKELAKTRIPPEVEDFDAPTGLNGRSCVKVEE